MSIALYRHYAADGTLLYVGITNSPKRRLAEHRARTGRTVARVDIEWFDSRAEALAVEREVIKAEAPRDNIPLPRHKTPATPLLLYMRKHGIRQADLAARLRVSQSMISKLLNGGRKPALRLALAIADLTEGAVPVDTWVPA